MSYHVDFCSRWDNPFVLDYNKYYLLGLSEAASLSSSTEPWYVRPVPGVSTKLRLARAVLTRVLIPSGLAGGSDPQHFVGQYVLETGSASVRFAIDPHDNRRIASKAILDWCDVYFKSNKWTSDTYPTKVLPLVNGNGVHTAGTLAHLRSLRQAPKTHDVTFIARLSSDVEHLLKVFEALSRLTCDKIVIAILYAEHGHDQYIRRLEECGVTCLRKNMPAVELWNLLARSRVAFLRLGAKQCVPWRMIDLLCMGSAVVVDRHPMADWPVPLVEGRNFVSCFGRDAGAADDLDYTTVQDAVNRVLHDAALARTMAEENAAYFDYHASPRVVADYVIRSLVTRRVAAEDTACSENVAPRPAGPVWINKVRRALKTA